ncbi:alpha/beta fold hydrolase [Paraburkholderia strydomiana]|uniref:alpha/beta fold hydrolase n=1 Tax=Paraburkholderia strydomiana TaxID=1245417 RepID=UPI0035B50F23
MAALCRFADFQVRAGTATQGGRVDRKQSLRPSSQSASGPLFQRRAPHVEKRYRVVAYDPRSQGLSTHTLDHNDHAQHGRDLAGFVDKLGLKDVILVAWSWGCLDAYSYPRSRNGDPQGVHLH